MFYSPKKNIQAFIESKNEEIKSLKQKILGSRITYEDMENAKSRLNILKSSHLGLQKQDHLELKQLLKTTHQAVNDLVKKKNRLVEQLEHHQKQAQQINSLTVELVNKKQKADQFLKDAIAVKEKLTDKKQKRNIQILQLEQQINTRRKELKMERQIAQELENARNQVKIKSVKVRKDLGEIVEQNKILRQNIRKQLQQIAKLQFQQQNDELRVQNLQLKIQKQQKHCLNLQHKIDAAQTFLQRLSQDKLIFLKQAETSSNLDSLLKMCTESNQKKQKEQKQCQQQINQLTKKYEKAAYKRQNLVQTMNNKQENLKQLKQKGAELKNILNSIFHQDSSVLKLLADKKVYQSQATKNQTQTNYVKLDKLQMMATSDNFFISGKVEI